MNPMNMLKSMFGSMNPKEMVSKMISNNSNPIVGNLVNMANKGDTKGIEEFASMCPKGNFVVTMKGHITAILNNCIVDTFDCSDRFMKCCWQIK